MKRRRLIPLFGLHPECSASATAEIGTIRILEPLRAPHYRERYLERLAKDGTK